MKFTKKLFAAKRLVSWRRRRMTKGKIDSESDGSVQPLKIVNTLQTSRGEFGTMHDDMGSVARDSTTLVGSHQTVEMFAARGESNRKTKTSTNAHSWFGINGKIAGLLGSGLHRKSLGRRRSREVLSHREFGDGVDLFGVHRKGGRRRIEKLYLT